MFMFHIAFTGHRKVEEADSPAIREGFDALGQFQWEEALCFHSGGAAGFDTIVADYTWPSLSAVETFHIPFQYQLDALYKHLTRISKQPYEEWLHFVNICQECGPKADYVRPVDNPLYLKRDRHMVDESRLLISYYNGQPGGTEYTINYAKKQGVPVIDIRELTLANLRERAEEARRRGPIL